MTDLEIERNNAAFRRLEDRIKSDYPHGQFVALVEGKIVADAGDFAELQNKLIALGMDPYRAFVVQAGHHYPKQAIILIQG